MKLYKYTMPTASYMFDLYVYLKNKGSKVAFIPTSSRAILTDVRLSMKVKMHHLAVESVTEESLDISLWENTNHD